MQRRAWLLQVRKGKEDEYRRIHTTVWPELIEAARQAGLRNHSCFLEGRSPTWKPMILMLPSANCSRPM
jgi:L-rhamnose mutarotase